MLSNSDKIFIKQALRENLREDKRSCREFRAIKISYKRTRGCCCVELGKTKVLSQISWDVVTPLDSRPNEGLLTVNVELPPYLAGQQTNSEINLLTSICVDRGLRDSKCVDLESLCIESAFKVFSIRVDLHLLNYDGNHIDTLLLCGVAALKHFRRPDVTYSGVEAIIHSEEEKDPLALTMLHLPVSTTFAIFVDKSSVLLVADPTDDEEKASDCKIMVVANKHDELCFIKTIGCQTSVTKETISMCCRLAVERAKEVSDKIDQVLEEDTKKREDSKRFKGVCMIMEADLENIDNSDSLEMDVGKELSRIRHNK